MSLPGATIVSRDWNDVAEGTASTGSMGTSAQGQILHEPLRGWASFSATFLAVRRNPTARTWATNQQDVQLTVKRNYATSEKSR